MNFQPTAVALVTCLLFSCSGGASDIDVSGNNELPNNQSQQPDTTDDNTTNEEATEAEVEQTSITSLETDFDVPQSETQGISITDTPPALVEVPQVQIGFSRQLPSCEEAGARIRSSIELGMSEAQVLSLVGRPLDAGPSGDRWSYGRLGDPSVKYQSLFLDGHLVNGPVSGFDTDVTRCDYYEAEKDVPLREATNSLLTQSSNVDFTNETPTCFDAGVRVTALIRQGLTTTEVRSLIGKPVEVSIAGTIWDYGDGTFTPEVWFGLTIENGVLAPTVAQGWNGDIRGCD